MSESARKGLYSHQFFFTRVTFATQFFLYRYLRSSSVLVERVCTGSTKYRRRRYGFEAATVTTDVDRYG
jgi:hypothetical protein